MIDKAEFFLKNYLSEHNVQLSFNNQILKIETDDNKFEEYKKLKDKLSNYSFAKLTILNNQDDDESLKLAIDIKNLLSLALGRRIIFDNQSYWHNENERKVNRKMENNCNNGVQIIHDSKIENFLIKTLPKWSVLSEPEKTNYYIIINYLNQTRKDFIDDGILRTMQAWECAANYWTNKVELSDDFKELQKRINKTFKDWKKDFEYIDENGEMGANLKMPLNQEKLLLRLEKFIAESNLNIQAINPNLRELKKMRDLVAHQGKIKNSGIEANHILEPCIKALQLIVLKRLGYDGTIIDSKNNYRTFDKIERYFKE